MARRIEMRGLKVGSQGRRGIEDIEARLRRKDNTRGKVWLREVRKALVGLSKNSTPNEAFGIVNLILDENQVEKFLQRQRPKSEQNYFMLLAFLRNPRIFKPIFEGEWHKRTVVVGQTITPKEALFTALDESLAQIYANVCLALYSNYAAKLFPGFSRKQIVEVGIQTKLLSRYLLMPKLWAVPERISG